MKLEIRAILLSTILAFAPGMTALAAADSLSAVADLTASNGATIEIEFQPAGGTGTPSSSDVAFFAENVRINVTLPWIKPGSNSPSPTFGTAKLLAVTKDGVLVDQYVTLQRTRGDEMGVHLTGTAFYPLLTKTNDAGKEKRYQQQLEIDLAYSDSQNNQTLINPKGDPNRFQLDLSSAAGQ